MYLCREFGNFILVPYTFKTTSAFPETFNNKIRHLIISLGEQNPQLVQCYQECMREL